MSSRASRIAIAAVFVVIVCAGQTPAEDKRSPAAAAIVRCRAQVVNVPDKTDDLRRPEQERPAEQAPGDAPTPKVVGIPKPPGITRLFGVYHALVIGNDAYWVLAPLRSAVNDARAVAEVLDRDYGFKVRLLLNATRFDLLSALNDFRERLGETDNLLIYYAGRGELDEKSQRGYWLPVDADFNSSANWISNIAVTDILNAMTVRQALVVADTCYAGTLTRSAMGRPEAGLTDAERLRLMHVPTAHKRSRLAMTSGGKEPVLDDDGGGHSVFQQIFIKLLRANVGVVSGYGLFTQLRLDVAGVADRVHMNQVPEYGPIKFAGHESGDFFFVRVSPQ